MALDSLVDFLDKQGVRSDMESRSALAASFGIEHYTGTAEQNTRLLEILQESPVHRAWDAFKATWRKIL